ncbi:MAG: endo-1,4-beta-xylanase [Bacteroidales bacterium]|nr:endo-1,4-beta-xylanase [Bacteroidales bacterium]MBN2820402.1 endo-1,4-beta-xylanase [Bacteroidales bacterium]
MKKIKTILFLMLLAISYSSFCQNEAIVLEAESAALGADYQTLTDEGITYITPQTDLIDGNFPASADKVVTFSVTFPDSGTYKFFARVRVGSGTWNDDSYFYGNGFGTKDPGNGDDWIMCNGLASAGQTYPYLVVENQGDAGAEIFKWVAFSDFTGGEAPVTFRVELGELTKTFEIGARENGLDFDKIAFGRAGLYYTVENLNNGEAGSVTPPEGPEYGLPLAHGLDKFLGCGYTPGEKEIFKAYWNQVTPGNAGKWGSVESTRDVMNWGPLDETYNFALENNFVYKHHVLVWGAQQPGWIAELDSAEQRAEIEEWFDTVAKRYPDMDQIEVVNEPLHQAPDSEHEGNYIKALGGAGETGWDWIIESFRLAREKFADTIDLLINEYGIMDNTTNTDRYLEIIKLLQEEDLIDGIGFQGHGFSHNGTNATYLRNIDTLASTGLPVYVTELDIDGNTDLEQVHNYMNLFPLLWEHPNIHGITLWGYEYGLWRQDAGANLVDQYGVDRPAFTWLKAYMKDEFVANESVIVSTQSGESTIETEGGTLQMVATFAPENTTLTTAKWSVNDNNIATISEDGLLTAVANGTITVKAISLELGSSVQDEMEITISGQPVSVANFTENSEIKLFPNPVKDGNFTISGMQNIELIEIIDLNGSTVKSFRIYNESSVDVNLDSKTGIYFVRLYGNDKYYYQKIIVK